VACSDWDQRVIKGRCRLRDVSTINKEMSKRGMSIRQIAAITGQDRKTIRADRLRARVWRPSLLLRDLKAQGYRGGITILADYLRQQQPAAQPDTFQWMLAVLQGAISHVDIACQLPDVTERERLLTYLREGRRSVRNRALAVLARGRGIPTADVCAFLHIGQKTLIRYCQLYRNGGSQLLMARSVRGPKKCDQQLVRDAVFSVLHTPPSEHGLNRTDWRMADIQAVLRKVGEPLGQDVIREIIRSAGYKWRKAARVVLTSSDPHYKEKVERIKKILSELGTDEAFFSIDEFGPFAIKKKGGRKRVAPGERFTVPQWQKSNGWTIVTAALELSSNQISHFYSMKKNTDEMIRMADVLRAEYRSRRKIYLSWDAASWHISKKLFDHLDGVNEHAAGDGYPTIETAPLPAGAQFLNVIESVFSGMARAVIHKSNYPSVDVAKSAIDLYFKERNFQFARNPKRAGNKIWGKKRVPSGFSESHNCKDPLYR